jgi:3-deoxy-D-manno-octulosonic-acid transferase
MALPILQRLRSELPGVQLAYTFFSPSAEQFAASLDVDFAAYLPFDTRSAADRIVSALRPTVLVYSKLDVWPILTERAHARGVHLGLISGSMPARSGRTHGIGAAILRDAYGVLDIVGAASADDARQLVRAGVREHRVRITGDTRYDQAWTRARVAPKHGDLLTTLQTERFTVVAGSTWPVDEGQLFAAWEQFARILPSRPRLIIAPHELHGPQLREIEIWAARNDFTCARLGNEAAVSADVVLVDRMGVLADLYALANVAYVGGGFHGHGLHSVVEPAVFHVPTLIGPQHSNSRDAILFRDAGGIEVVHDAMELATTLQVLATDAGQYAKHQHRVADVVSHELGAARRSFEIVRELLGPMKQKALHEMHAE